MKILLIRYQIFENHKGELLDTIECNEEYENYAAMNDFLKNVETEWLRLKGIKAQTYATYKEF